MMRYFNPRLFVWLLITGLPFQPKTQAQDQADRIAGNADLISCLKYALVHQPLIRQLQLRDEISRRNVAIALSDWLPSLDLNAGYQQYLQQPISIFPDLANPSGPKREITTGVKNTSSVLLSANQVIYNPEVIIAGTTAKYYRRQSSQTIQETKIDLVVKVSKAFYDVLLTQARLDFLQEDQSRLNKSMNDAKSQYESGVNDKIDYQRALIAFNNIQAEILGTSEEIKAKKAYLKEIMGYPVESPIAVVYDSVQMMKDAYLDTTGILHYQNRIEYQLLRTNLYLQKSNVSFYRYGFLPTVSVYANYNLVYQNDKLNDLYNRDFPNSSAGVKLTLPLFQGSKRWQQLRRASLELKDLQLDTLNLKNRMNTQYEQALASYKSNLKAFLTARGNAQIAYDIYNTVRLQYNQGIKAYLEVIVSEADLRTARINELDALFRLLSSKLDVETALGNIPVNY